MLKWIFSLAHENTIKFWEICCLVICHLTNYKDFTCIGRNPGRCYNQFKKDFKTSQMPMMCTGILKWISNASKNCLCGERSKFIETLSDGTVFTLSVTCRLAEKNKLKMIDRIQTGQSEGCVILSAWISTVFQQLCRYLGLLLWLHSVVIKVKSCRL